MYIVKLAADDTVGKLRRYLESAVAGLSAVKEEVEQQLH